MKEETIEILKKYNQEHILSYLELLTQEEQENLEKQILSINFEQLATLFQNTKKEVEITDKKIEHIPYIDKSKLSEEDKKRLSKIGEKIILDEKYALVTLAGGQGTRLRTYRPKRNLCFTYK